MNRRRQQNLKDARTFFNTDLTKDIKDKFKDHRIDSEMFERGKRDAYDEIIIPDNMKDNFSYISGFNYAKRQLKIQEDMYKMGKEHFLNGYKLDDTLANYKNNADFIRGYRDAMYFKLENDVPISRIRR